MVVATHRRTRGGTGLALVAASLVIAVAVALWVLTRGSDPADLADVESSCGDEAAVTLNSSESTLRFHFDEGQDARDELRCALDALDFPHEIDDDFPTGGGRIEWDDLTLVWSLTSDGRGPVAISRSE